MRTLARACIEGRIAALDYLLYVARRTCRTRGWIAGSFGRHGSAIPTCQLDSTSADGRMKWQVATGYGKRSLAETAIGRYKSIIGRRLRARSFRTQQTEVAIGCIVLNRMLACARPKSIRCRKKATA